MNYEFDYFIGWLVKGVYGMVGYLYDCNTVVIVFQSIQYST